MKENNNFEKKSQVINTILGCVIVIAFLIAGVIVLRFIINLLIDGTENLLHKLSKMDVVVIVALITGASSALSVFAGTIIGKLLKARQSKREYLTKQREQPYSDFVEMIYKIQMSTKPGQEYSEQELLSDISKVSKQITLWGSSNVVNKWVKFRKNSTNKEKATIFICRFNYQSAKASREQVDESMREFEKNRQLQTMPYLQIEMPIDCKSPLFVIDEYSGGVSRTCPM